MAQHEFLPLCDVLFNIISLAAYFCDVVFDVVMGYALLVNKQYEWFIVTMIFVIFSSITQQIISARWYLRVVKAKATKEDKDTDTKSSLPVIKQLNVISVLLLHVAQLGVFWRYFKLFIPVDLRFVKYEVRDLCMLRLVHAFCESMPLLLMQLFLYWENYSAEFSDLNAVAISLSLFSVCWALASFSKNVRMHNVHKLVLTWLGVIFQVCVPLVLHEQLPNAAPLNGSFFGFFFPCDFFSSSGDWVLLALELFHWWRTRPYSSIGYS